MCAGERLCVHVWMCVHGGHKRDVLLLMILCLHTNPTPCSRKIPSNLQKAPVPWVASSRQSSPSKVIVRALFAVQMSPFEC